MTKIRNLIAGLLLGVISLVIVAVLSVSLLNQKGAQAAPANQLSIPEVQLDQAAASTNTPAATQSDEAKYLDAFLQSFAGKLGVSQDKLNSTFTEALSDTIDQAVKDGKLDAASAAKVKAAVSSKDGIKALLPLLIGEQESGQSIDVGNPKALLMSGMEQVAKFFNTTRDQLLSRLQYGQSLTDLAKAQNIDVGKIKDTLLNSAKSQLEMDVKNGQLTQAQSDTDFNQFSTNFLDKFINSRQTPPSTNDILARLVKGTGWNGVAGMLNLTEDELKTRIGSGQTIAQIAQAQHIDLQKFKETLLNSSKTQLDALVKSGDITQAQADAAFANAPTVIDNFVNGRPFIGPKATPNSK